MIKKRRGRMSRKKRMATLEHRATIHSSIGNQLELARGVMAPALEVDAGMGGWEGVSISRKVNIFFLASYLYYELDAPFISDLVYDALCKNLQKNRYKISTHLPRLRNYDFRTGSAFDFHDDWPAKIVAMGRALNQYGMDEPMVEDKLPRKRKGKRSGARKELLPSKRTRRRRKSVRLDSSFD